MQITEFFSKKNINISFRKQAAFFMSFRDRKCLFNNSNSILGKSSIFSPTSVVDGLSINLGDIPFLEIRNLIFFNNVIFFIQNIIRTTSPGANKGVGSPQPIHTILGLALNYHVFLNTITFCNTYPKQPYTSHALHALFGSNGPYCSVMGIHFRSRVAPTTVRRGHNKGVSKVRIDTDRQQRHNNTIIYISKA